jgi:hypothetical protein
MTLESAALANLIQIAFLVVTGLGAILIVKQLREARLASQMAALMELNQQHEQVTEAIFLIRKVIQPEIWISLTEEERVARLNADESLNVAWRKIANFYDMLGLLVRSKSFDKQVAFKFYGFFTVSWFQGLEPAINELRERAAFPTFFEHFEWLAIEFEKMK